MARPTHTVVITLEGEVTVVLTEQVPFKVKGTSEVKALKIKQAMEINT